MVYDECVLSGAYQAYWQVETGSGSGLGSERAPVDDIAAHRPADRTHLVGPVGGMHTHGNGL